MFDHLWAVFTIAAAGAQTARNALQRSLVERLGTVGATHVRFLYGLPFALLFLVLVTTALGRVPPAFSLGFLGWVALGAFMQIVATALLLAAMRERSFVVTIAYSKTEPVQVALFAVAVLGEPLTASMLGASALGTLGVILMSWPSKAKAGDAAFSLRPALLGIASGGLFALSAVGFRGAILALGSDSFVLNASTALAVSLALQAGALTLYLLVTERRVLGEIVGAWRVSVFAGFMGAFASQMWFLSFALEQVARVRTLGLIEMLFAWAISRNVLKQTTSPREAIGIVLVLAAAAWIING